MKRFVVCVSAVVWVGIIASCGEPASELDVIVPDVDYSDLEPGELVPNQYNIVLRPGYARNLSATGRYQYGPSVRSVAESLVGTYNNANIVGIYEHALEGFTLRMHATDAQALRYNPMILSIDQDRMVRLNGTQNNPPSWRIDRVDQENLPLSKSYSYNTTASNVHAYVMDTGLNASHNDFQGRVGDGFDAVGDGGGTTDNHGHGTHTAGTVGGATFGIAKGVIIHPVQVLDSQGSAPWSVIIKCL